MQGRLFCGAVLTTLILSKAPPAFAQGKTPEAARAEVLYDEALTLVEKGRHAEACPKLAESQKLDPALGTQFNLADCYEHIGKPATALLMFNDVERAARAAGKANLAASAKQRADKLGPKTPKLRIVLENSPESATLQIDGVATDFASAVAGNAPVDPGVHALTVSAPRYVAWTGKVTAGDSGVVETRVPALVEDTGPEGPPPPTTFTTTRKVGLGAAGVGLLAVGVGSVFGLMAISKKNEAVDVCGNSDPSKCAYGKDFRVWDDAKSLGNISTISFIAGGVLVASGAVLWFLGAPSASKPTVTGGVDPNGGGSIGLRGVW